MMPPMALTHMIASESQIVFVSKGCPSIEVAMTPRSMTATAPILSAMKSELKMPTMIEP